MESESEALVRWNPESQQLDGDLLVKSRLYNAVLHDAVKQSGLTQKQYADSLGFNVNFLSQFITLRGSPWHKSGAPRQAAQKLALHIEIPFDELFPRSLYILRHLVPPEFLQKRYASAELVPLLEARNVPALENPSSIYDRKEVEQLLEKTLCELTPREEKVIKMRFGMEGKEHSLEEIGKSFNKGRERIRQIEAKALRKLRQPLISKALQDLLAIKRGGRFKPIPAKGVMPNVPYGATNTSVVTGASPSGERD